jgi:hypothetical protein
MMTIEKSYEENAIVGNYTSIKIGLKIKSDKDIKSPAELEEFSKKLLLLAKGIVKKELQEIKTEQKKEE